MSCTYVGSTSRGGTTSYVTGAYRRLLTFPDPYVGFRGGRST